jgi:hypothetical protein
LEVDSLHNSGDGMHNRRLVWALTVSCFPAGSWRRPTTSTRASRAPR